MDVEMIDLASVEGWSSGPDAAEIRHLSGAFFSIVGVDAMVEGRRCQQPVIHQPEVGILGLGLSERDGVLQLLMQAKAEPGTVGGIQMSPTVQATYSNYTRRHGGSRVPYVEDFIHADAARSVGDVLQSEQGSRFLGKRNRNVVRWLDPAQTVHPGHAWFTIADVHRAIRTGDQVNFDSRTVLALLHAHQTVPAESLVGHDQISRDLIGSLRPGSFAAHPDEHLWEWIEQARSRPATVQMVALQQLPGWVRRDGRLVDETRLDFSVAGVRVRSSGREVAVWSQPIIVESETSVLGLAVTMIGGVAHCLLQVRDELGLTDGAELGPTVHQASRSVEEPGADPGLLRIILDATPGSVVFDGVLSAEGGRFMNASQRHLVVLTDHLPEPPGHRWVAVHQLAGFIRHGHVVNEEARSLFACLMSLLTPSADPS